MLQQILNGLMVLVTEITDKIGDSLNFTVFNKDQIHAILKKVSSSNKNYLADYNHGKIKCVSCNKIIGPKSKENLILGAVFLEGDNIKFVCSELKCYEGALR